MTQNVLIRKRTPYRKMDGCSIIHLGSRRIYLNEVGTRIWDLIDSERSKEEIAREFAHSDGETQLPFQDAVSVVETFINDLYGKGLLENADQVLPDSEPAALSASNSARTPTDAVTCQYRPAPASENGALGQRATSMRERIFQLYWNKQYIEKLHLELTYRCNLRCCHCYNSSHSGASRELTAEQWINVLEQAASLGCYFLVFTGGEPFARKDILDIFQAACRLGFAFRVNTNGSMVRKEQIPELQGMTPFLQGLDISFYGATPEVHDKVTSRPGSYDRTRAVLDSLLQAQIPVVAKYVTMNMNFEELRRFDQEMRAAGIPRAINTGSMIPRTDRNPAPLNQLLSDDQYRQMLASRGRPEACSTDCVPGWNRGGITADGFVGPCEWLGDIKLGNVRETSLKDIWYGPGFQSLRESLTKTERECTECELRTVCSSCPAHAYLETGSLVRCAPVQRHNAELSRNFFFGTA